MYLLVFKNPTSAQKEFIEQTFNDYDWPRGFAVEEVVVNEILNDNYVIQFVSSKEFDMNKLSDQDDLSFSLLNKEQFLCHLFFSDIEADKIPSYFGNLGSAMDERDSKNEKIYKIQYGKYSSLEEAKLSLEELLNS